MELLARFLSKRSKDWAKVLGIRSLNRQIASQMEVFALIRGRKALLDPRLAIALRRNNGVSVTTHLGRLDKSETLVAIVFLQDLQCYKDVTTILSDDRLRHSVVSSAALDELINQATTELLRQANSSNRRDQVLNNKTGSRRWWWNICCGA